MEEREAYISLNMMERVGPVSVRSLVSALGSATAIFEAGPQDLAAVPEVSRDVVQAIINQRHALDWRQEMSRAASQGVRIVTWVDEEYPEPLRAIHDPPLALYVRGTLRASDRQSIAVVGTRRPTHYGREIAAQLASQLARAGFTIVSGMAEGIDAAAHRAALKSNGRTLAVLGGGMNRLYPPSHAELSEAIAAAGAVLSEFPMDRPPDRTTFPIRNRIVSGLSKGVVVVEAGLKSGAMITARMALEQGRQVFAVPGRVDSSASQGCHALIREGAPLVTGAADILSEFEILLPAVGTSFQEARSRPQLSAEEAVILDCLSGGEMDVDTLIRSSGLSAAAVNALLVSLEMKRLVRVLPGRMVELAVKS